MWKSNGGVPEEPLKTVALNVRRLSITIRKARIKETEEVDQRGFIANKWKRLAH